MRKLMCFILLLFIYSLNPIRGKSDTSNAPDTKPAETGTDKNDGTHRSKAPSRKNIEIHIQGNVLAVRFLSAEGNATMEILDEYSGNTESYSFDTSLPFSCILSHPGSKTIITIETRKNIYTYFINI